MTTSDVNTTNVDLSHYIQREVLIYLRQHGTSSYQALKPDGLEGNAYNYHLRLLKQAHLISHTNGKYALTPVGYLVSDAYSYASRRLMLRPHLYSVLFVTANEHVLVYEHFAGPLKGKIGLPSGKLHYGESFASAIAKEMERRQLSDDYSAVSLCPINIRYVKDKQPIVHRPGIVWRVDYSGPLTERETGNGRSCWVRQNDLAATGELLPEVSEAVERLSKDDACPIDQEFTLG